MLRVIKRRKTAYLGHVMRGKRYQFLQLIIEGTIEGRRGLRRKKMSWLRNIRHWTEIGSAGDLIHTARNRKEMENVIANVH